MKVVSTIIVALTLLVVGTATMAQPGRLDDLTMVRSTFFGRPSNIGYLLDITTDAQGNVYGTGWCLSIQATPGAYRTVSSGRNDIMVFKMDPSLSTVLWATYIGGSNDEAGGSIAINAQGEVIVSGYTLSPNFPVINGVGASYLQDEYVNTFVLKLSPDGSQLVYSSILGRGQAVQKGLENAGRGALLALNPQGEAIVYTHTPVTAGYYSLTPNGYQLTNRGKTDLAYSKVSTSGAVLYSTLFGGLFDEMATDICYANGKVYMLGYTASANIPLQAGKAVDAGDCFVLVADDNGTIVPPRKCFIFGSGSADVANAIGYDAGLQRLCVGGVALSSNFPYTSVLQSGQVSGGFVCTIDTALTTVRSGAMLGLRVVPRSLCIGTDSRVVISGYVTPIGTVAVTANALQSSPQGNFDAFITVVDSSLATLLYGSYLGGNAEDYSSVRVRQVRQGCFVHTIVGLTSHSTSYPVTLDSYQPDKLNGGEDQPAITMFAHLNDVQLFKDIKICNRELNASMSGACNPMTTSWDFGDGTRDAGSSVKHIYAKSGTYTVRIKLTYPEPDTVVVTREVVMTGPLQVDAGPDKIVCSNNSRTQLHASFTQKYEWTPAALFDNPTVPNPMVDPKQTTTYYLRGTDVNGCTSVDSVTLYVNEAHAFTSPDTSVCRGQTLLLHASGGLQIEWKPDTTLKVLTQNDVLVKPMVSTTYHVVVTNGLCSDTAAIVVRVRELPRIAMPPQQFTCPGNALELKPKITWTPGTDSTITRFQWLPLVNISDPQSTHPIVRPTQNMWYYCEVSTTDGCMYRDSVYVVMKAPAVVSMIPDTGVCRGQSILLWARGASSYQWSPAEGLDDPTRASPLCTPTRNMVYMVVTSNGPCTDSQRVIVQIIEYPRLRIVGDTAVCEYSSGRLSVAQPEPGVIYQWSPTSDMDSSQGAEIVIHPKTTTTYRLVATNQQGCRTVDSTIVHISNPLQLDAGPDQSVCLGEECTVQLRGTIDSSVTVEIDPPVAAFDRASSSFHIKPTVSSQYVVRAFRSGCEIRDTVHLNVKSSVRITSITSDTSVCRGSTVQLHADAVGTNVRYHWQVAGSGRLIVDNPDSAQTLTAVLDSSIVLELLVTADGCTDSRRVAINVVHQPTLQPYVEPRLCVGEQVRLQLISDQQVRARWTPPTGLSTDTSLDVVIAPTANTTYSLVLTNQIGCSATYTIKCLVSQPQSISLRMSSVTASAGAAADLKLLGKSSIPTTLDGSTTVRCPAALFLPDRGYKDTVDGTWRVITLNLPDVSIGPSESIIATVHGTALSALTTTGSLEILNTTLPSLACLEVREESATISVISCFNAGRGVVLHDESRAVLSPHPVGERLKIHLSSLDNCLVTARILDSFGRELKLINLQHNSAETVHEVLCDDLIPGLYCVELSTEQGLMKRQTFIHTRD